MFGLGKMGAPGGKPSAPFNPLNLFASGEEGAIYDPSVITTLYQDSVGLVPVASANDPAGLVLDYRDPAYSVAFDGSGDYLTTTITATNIRTDSFTIEAWCNISTTVGFVLCTDNAGGSNLYISVAGTTLYVGDGVINTLSTPASNLPTGSWFHIAVSFDGTTYKLFIDGVQKSTSTNLLKSYSLAALRVGHRNATGLGITGNMSNFRFVKGSAVYTEAFTPSTEALTAITGTELLTCGNSDSGNPAITTAGNVVAVSDNPFTSGAGYHAKQSTAAARPLYKLDGSSLPYLDDDGVDDALVVTLPDLGADATIAYVTSGGVTITGSQTISGATTLPHVDFYGMLYIDRALTAGEQTGLTAYFNTKAGL